MSKIISKREAVRKIKDGDTVGMTGFVMSLHPETLSSEVETYFLETGSPRNLTVTFSNGIGDSKTLGGSHFAHPGLTRRCVTGHYALAARFMPMIADDSIEAHCLPQGTLNQLWRARAGGRPGIITPVGLGTFVDPRLEGGKMNAATKRDLVSVMKIDGEEYLFYRTFDINVALIRATTADEKGNLSMEHEFTIGEALALAQAAKASGGIVIAEVKRVVKAGSLDPRTVRIPHVVVDYIVISDEGKHKQSQNITYDPSISGEIRRPLGSVPVMPLDERKVMARRAAMETAPGMIINLGIGVPAGISSVMTEEGLSDATHLTIEAGVYGGSALGLGDFGCSYNPEAFIDMPAQFDYYDGGNLEFAALGMAELDSKGNVNVSKYGVRAVGPGGFINVSQSAKTMVYTGALTAVGLQLKIGDGKLSVLQEGSSKKFVKAVKQVTYSGEYAKKRGQKVLYITERAVFTLTPEGVELIEIAPGIDLQKDVLDQIEGDVIVSKNLKTMDARIFCDKPMGIKDEILRKQK